MANGKRNRKFIKSLLFEKGKILDNIENIFEEIVYFFGNLYSKPPDVSWMIERMDWSPIATKSAIWLDRHFLKEEVHNVVFQ